MMVTTTASLQHQHSTFNQLRRQFFIVGFDLKSVVKILAKILGKRQSVPVQLQLITNQLLSPRNSHLKTCGRIEEKSLRLVSRQYNSVQNVHYSRYLDEFFFFTMQQYILSKRNLFSLQFTQRVYEFHLIGALNVFLIKIQNSKKILRPLFIGLGGL